MRYLFSLILFIWGAAIAHADVLPIQSFKTPKGLEVWLVEDKSSPIVSLVITFSQTEMHSPLEPISILLGAAINDGSGIMTPLELEREANSLPFKGSIYMGITKDSLHLKTTKTGLPATLKLWSRLVGSPQFHEKGLERSRVQANSTVSFLDENLSDIAYFNLLHAVFKDPLFQLALDKAPKIINSLPSSDLKKRASLHFLQKRPHIVAVGNTTQKELSTLLDSTFGALPLVSASSSSSPKPHWKANTIFLTRDVSQATIALGHPGVDPQSKDYPQFLLLEYILNQRFYEEIREKRGLVYGIGFSHPHYNGVNLLSGEFSCACPNAHKVVKFVRSEWERLKDFGITERELTQAKLYFKQAHILNLTSTSAVAGAYADFQNAKLGPRATATLLEKTEKVTFDAMNAFMGKFFDSNKLIFSIIGPDSLMKEKK